MSGYKSGFIAITGRPNAGKSTLLNALVGEKISIVSPKPQTTRNKIIGVMHGEDYQAVFVDTPGIHGGKNKLSEFMARGVDSAFLDVDAVIYVLAADKHIDGVDRDAIGRVISSKTPLLLVINKCDALKDKSVIPFKISQFLGIAGIDAIIPISAKTGKSVDILKSEIVKRLVPGEQFYDDDTVTDKSVRFMCGEILREKAFLNLSDEIPYGIGVAVEEFSETDTLISIKTAIVCEKDAHKPIIIGRGGAVLKRISSSARLDMEKLLDKKVFLSVFVKVKENWRDNTLALGELGYGKNDI